MAVQLSIISVNFGPKFLLHLHLKPTPLWWVHWPYTVGGKTRWRGRGLATRPICKGKENQVTNTSYP